MRSVSIYRLRDNLASYLDNVVETEVPVVISRFRKPLAVIMPYKGYKTSKIEDFFGFLGKGENGEQVLKRIRRSSRERRKTAAMRSRT